MPPPSSSHTGEPSHTAAEPAAATEPVRHSIQISSLGLLGVFLLAFGLSFVIFPSPPWVSVLWLIPIAVAYWMLRVRTVVDTVGLHVRRPFSSEVITWDQVKGIRFPKRSGWARAELTDGTEKTLPVVTFGRLPLIAEASGGRVTDPYAVADRIERERREQERAEREAAEEHGAESAPDTE
ncbi:PH domain-containing protein [Rhodococcus sp. NPDC003348]